MTLETHRSRQLKSDQNKNSLKRFASNQLKRILLFADDFVLVLINISVFLEIEFFFASYSVTLKVSARNLNQYVSFFSCADNSLNDQLILVMVNICKLLQRSKKYPIQAISLYNKLVFLFFKPVK